MATPREGGYELEGAEELVEALFDSAPVPAALTDGAGRIRRVNVRLRELLATDPEIAAPGLKDLVRPGDHGELTKLLEEAKGGPARRELVLGLPGGSTSALVTVVPVRGPQDEIVHLVVHVQPQTAARTLEDPMTGLSSKVLFMDRLTHALARIRRLRSPVSVLTIDIDGFRRINREHGTETGDAVLRWVAGILRRSVRPADTVARLEGDEFAVLCEDTSGERDAVRVADRLVHALGRPVHVGELELSVKVSIGIAFAREADTPDALLASAGAAMYRVKEGGRGSYEISLDALDP
jgi:diguanylate cyclase (GGDEF)-like protein